MATLPSLEDLAERLDRVQTDFLKIEISLGQTFSGIALDTKDPETRSRNQRAARKAFDTALRFLDRVGPSGDETRLLEKNLLLLRLQLARLGETFLDDPPSEPSKIAHLLTVPSAKRFCKKNLCESPA